METLTPNKRNHLVISRQSVTERPIETYRAEWIGPTHAIWACRVNTKRFEASFPARFFYLSPTQPHPTSASLPVLTVYGQRHHNVLGIGDPRPYCIKG